MGILGLLIGAACAAELARRRRRRRARIGAYLRPYGLPPDVGPRMPAPAAAASAEAEAEEGAGAEADAAPATSDGVTTGLRPGAAVIGYAAVPAEASDEHVRSRDRVIERACERSGWRLVEIVHEPDGGRVLERPGLSAALERIHAGTAQGLVVSDARLMSRAADFAALVQRFREEHAPLIALDLGVDTSTREGRRVASALVTLNGWARIASRRNGRVPQEATRPANGAGAHLDREPSPLKDGVTG
ncbi:MAG: recombinase family protein [Solirubrobacteraceae bacterium]